MQPGMSNMQPTPGYKGNEPAHGDPLPGDATPLAGRVPLVRRLIAMVSRSHSRPKG
jgi:hypothetical protein